MFSSLQLLFCFIYNEEQGTFVQVQIKRLFILLERAQNRANGERETLFLESKQKQNSGHNCLKNAKNKE